MKTTIKKLEKSEIEITGVLEVAEFEKYEKKALERIGERMELPGFRKGKAPVAIVKENVQEMQLLEEMAEVALQENYIKILQEEKIDAIGRPQISITKIGKGSDLEFKIVTAVLPEMKLGDYKNIAKKENSKDENKKEIVVDEKEIEKVILDLRKMRAEQKVHDTNIQMKTNDTNNIEEDVTAHNHTDVPESEYPAFDDKFAKSFG
ncbi:MAG: trigger factor family protein, partial [Candidatus Shapirobacteria bacterium]